MRRRKAKPSKSALESPTPTQEIADSGAPRVLVVTGDPATSQGVRQALESEPMTCDVASSAAEAREALRRDDHDAVIVSFSLPDAHGVDLVRDMAALGSHARVVMVDPDPSVGHALTAMRSGAVDLIGEPIDGPTLIAGVSTAVELARRTRDQERRVERLKRICRRLNDARRTVTTQVDSLCNDLAGAYQELADQVSHVALASEFESLIRQELDVEQLLRTALEFLLARTGPMNAAVFLPSNHSDFSLGAYVNYDCPKDTADMLLDHLADVIAPRFQDEDRVLRFDEPDELDAWIGEDANWLQTSQVIVFSCRHEGECLAVGALFRDRTTPFDEELPSQLHALASLFAKQLARVVRVHHRHTPDEKWSGWDTWEPGDEDDESGGLAA